MPRRMLGRRGTLIIGVDLVKDANVLNAAYDDAAGVTAKFNLNLLARINRELGADFDLDALLATRPSTMPSAAASRCISPAASARRCGSAGRMIEFRAGETIHTESSYKYTVESFGALARAAPAGRRRGLDRREGIFLGAGAGSATRSR